MARRSSIDRMSETVRAHIERRLAEGRMTLNELIADLTATFPDAAASGDLPSRSAVGRYGQKLSRRLDAIKASTEAAKLISASAGDSQDARSEALTALVQTELFEAILNLQEAGEAADAEDDPGERVQILANAAKNIATLTRSSVNLKKFQAEAEARARQKYAEELKAEAEKITAKPGVTPETQAAIRALLGIR